MSGYAGASSRSPQTASRELLQRLISEEILMSLAVLFLLQSWVVIGCITRRLEELSAPPGRGAEGADVEERTRRRWIKTGVISSSCELAGKGVTFVI